MRFSLAFFAALLFALPAAAQPGGSVFAPGPAPLGVRAALTPPDSACTYDVCALRVEPGFGGTRLVRGESGQPVATLGLFGGSVQQVVRGSERALPHARTYDRASTSGAILTALGGAVLMGSPLLLQGDRGTAGFGTVGTAALAGLALVAYGGLENLTAQRALSRAVWEYNRDLRR